MMRQRLSAPAAAAGYSKVAGVAFDVVRGAKQFVTGGRRKSVLENGRVGHDKAVTLDRHPLGEFVRKPRQGLFGKRDRVV